jgi:hypothetical protein
MCTAFLVIKLKCFLRDRRFRLLVCLTLRASVFFFSFFLRRRQAAAFEKLPIAENLEREIEGARKAVSTDVSFLDVFKTYEDIIHRILSSSSAVSEPLENSNVDRIVTAHLIFARIKESHAQLQGLIAGILTSGSFSLEQGKYQKLLQIMGMMRAFTSSFECAVMSPFRPLPQRFLDKCSSLPRQVGGITGSTKINLLQVCDMINSHVWGHSQKGNESAGPSFRLLFGRSLFHPSVIIW